ncbi:NAD-binding protein [Pyrobaculum ferrireducens]|uniref:FAD-dependent pyridine nucleotide-disulfide oxidoreductase n=1 Tax=Pyrobaculum ferrireducens TaxID=1104324 RepID=G7VEH7_9CREN|nr:FAD/NAD(P)-binding oxidoreductase [Pyrobaculum ferrireducens]AET31601.1 FAD-dependent pyridine nucleotide-disulfide oxidoreductase [Pyrobaculum ferrireducens]
MRVVVVGGGVAGLYFASEFLKFAPHVTLVVVDPKPIHEFVIGIPLAFAGLVDFEDLAFPFSDLRRVVHVKAAVVSVEGGCVRTNTGPVQVCGDYVVLAPGGYKVGSAEYWSVEGSRRLFQAVEGSRAVRFVVNEFTPVAGFAEIAYAIKTRFPEKDVSIHVVFIHDDYKMFMSIQREHMVKSGVEISEEPPPYREGELRVSVPAVRIHPIAAGLDVDPVTFETQHERVYLIGDSSLLKLGLPPIGWGALWQASTLARALAQEVSTGVFEVEATDWVVAGDRERFLKWLTYRMTTGTPVVHLKGLFDLWRASVLRPLSGE